MRYSTAPGLLRVARRSALLCTAVCAFVCLDAQRASGQDRLEREGRIRAALILNIAKLVTWPAESTAELTICVYDEAGFITPLATIEGEMVQGRRVTVMEIEETSAAVGCQIVFIGAGAADRLDEIQAVLSGHPTLTVGDIPDFAERGGAIGFTSRRNHVQLEINLQAVEASGLQISSQLVRFARIVHRPTGS